MHTRIGISTSQVHTKNGNIYERAYVCMDTNVFKIGKIETYMYA